MNPPKQMITGVYLPGEVAFNNQLTHADKMVWWVIYCLDYDEAHCYASNEYFVDKLGLGRQKVSDAITKLVELGYVKRLKNKQSLKRVLAIDNRYIKRYRHLVVQWNETNESLRHPAHTPAPHGAYIIKEDNSVLTKVKTDAVGIPERFAPKTTVAVERIINEWNSLTLFVTHQKIPTSKKYHRLIAIIKKALKRNNKKEIIEAIHLYHEIASDPYSKINFADPVFTKDLEFFFKPDPKKTEKSRTRNANIKSCFDEALKGKDYLDKTYRTLKADAHPELTAEFKKLWGGYMKQWNKVAPKRYSVKDEQLIIKAVQKFYTFWDTNNDKLYSSHTRKDPKANPLYFLPTLFSYLETKPLQEIYYLCSETFMDTDFKRWLLENEYMQTQKRRRRLTRRPKCDVQL